LAASASRGDGDPDLLAVITFGLGQPVIADQHIDGRARPASGLWVSHDIAERGGEGIHPKAMPVILTTPEEIET